MCSYKKSHILSSYLPEQGRDGKDASVGPVGTIGPRGDAGPKGQNGAPGLFGARVSNLNSLSFPIMFN